MSKPSIIIIGAGAAGIASAVRLYENGFKNIKLLEAENRIGGRIHSFKFGQSMIDFGAQWCHGEKGNIVYESVHNLNLLEKSRCTYKDNVFYDSTGNIVDKAITDQLFAISIGIAEDDSVKEFNGTYGDYFIKRYMENVKKEFGSERNNLHIANMFLHWFHKLELIYEAAHSWFDLAPTRRLDYEQCEGESLLNWKDKGFKIFFDVLMKKYPENKPNFMDNIIHLNKEVCNILWQNNVQNEVILKCSDGTDYTADHVIVTTSLGVLKECHHKIFYPKLPFYKANAIESTGFGTVDKLLIKFPSRWWNPEDTNFCFVWTEDDRMNILNEFPVGPIKNGHSWLEDINGFYIIDSDPTILIGWMVGKHCREVELLEDFILQKGCMYLLNKFLGDIYEIPEPEQFISSKWKTNPHFLGSYSYNTVQMEKRNISRAHLAEPLITGINKPTVLFAGEATHLNYFSAVHGAVESGYREADRLVDYYNSLNENDVTAKFVNKL